MLGMPSGPPRTPSNVVRKKPGIIGAERIGSIFGPDAKYSAAATRIVRPAAHSPLTMCGRSRMATPEDTTVAVADARSVTARRGTDVRIRALGGRADINLLPYGLADSASDAQCTSAPSRF